MKMCRSIASQNMKRDFLLIYFQHLRRILLEIFPKFPLDLLTSLKKTLSLILQKRKKKMKKKRRKRKKKDKNRKKKNEYSIISFSLSLICSRKYKKISNYFTKATIHFFYIEPKSLLTIFKFVSLRFQS